MSVLRQRHRGPFALTMKIGFPDRSERANGEFTPPVTLVARLNNAVDRLVFNACFILSGLSSEGDQIVRVAIPNVRIAERFSSEMIVGEPRRALPIENH